MSQLKLAIVPWSGIYSVLDHGTLRLSTCYSSMILQTVLFWSILVRTLVLGHLDLPLPGDGCRGVDVDGDGDTGVAGGDKHVLAGVVPAVSNERGKYIFCFG